MLVDSDVFKEMIFKRITTKFSKQELEQFLGITIKLAENKKVPVYNVYDQDGKLLLALKEGYNLEIDISNTFRNVIRDLCNKAEKDDETSIKNAKKAKREFEKIEKQKEIERKKDWVNCPRCGVLHPEGTHYCNW